MTEGSGNVVRDVCNGNDGTWTQGVSWAADADGPFLQFTAGDGPRVEVNAPVLSQNTALTVELRMQTVGGEGRVISQMLRPDGTRGALRWLLKLDGRQLEVWGETGSNGIPDSPLPSFPGGWTHVAWQINGNQVSLYYDGVLRASRTLESPQTLRSLAAITEFGSGERIAGFGGRIQFVRISSGIRGDFLLNRSSAAAQTATPTATGTATPTATATAVPASTPTWELLTARNAAGSPSGRSLPNGVWDSQASRLLVFGGQDHNAFRNDLWQYASAGGWQQLTGQGAAGSPPGRDGHTAAWDDQAGRMLMFAGSGRNDLWQYNGAGGWQELTANGAAGSPPGRHLPAAAWDSQAGRLLVFGGFIHSSGTSKIFFNDLWQYTTGGGWQQLTADGATGSPPGRSGLAAAWDRQAHRLLAFGGNEGSTLYNDLWEYGP